MNWGKKTASNRRECFYAIVTRQQTLLLPVTWHVMCLTLFGSARLHLLSLEIESWIVIGCY